MKRDQITNTIFLSPRIHFRSIKDFIDDEIEYADAQCFLIEDSVWNSVESVVEINLQRNADHIMFMKTTNKN